MDGSAVEAEFTGSGSYKGYAVKVGGTVRALSGSRLLTVNYYDNYDFLGKNGFPAYAYDSSMESSGYGTKSDARGMLTGSVTGLAGDGAGQLYSVVYYDRRSRPVQRQGSNSLGGKERNTRPITLPASLPGCAMFILPKARLSVRRSVHIPMTMQAGY